MKIKHLIICLMLLCMEGFLADSGLSQTFPGSGQYQAIIQSRSGTDGLVIGDQIYRVAPDAPILNIYGNLVRIDQILLPADAMVRFVVTPDGETIIESVKLEVFPK